VQLRPYMRPHAPPARHPHHTVQTRCVRVSCTFGRLHAILVSTCAAALRCCQPGPDRCLHCPVAQALDRPYGLGRSAHGRSGRDRPASFDRMIRGVVTAACVSERLRITSHSPRLSLRPTACTTCRKGQRITGRARRQLPRAMRGNRSGNFELLQLYIKSRSSRVLACNKFMV
jgi:hypothetical protein